MMLRSGMLVRYRKVGTARLVERDMQLQDSPEYAATQQGWWRVEWVKAPKSYREKRDATYWISVRDIVEE